MVEMILRGVLIYFLLIGCAFAEAFPNGLWNGKPPKKATVFEGGERGDPQAMAEHAYWSRHGWVRTKFIEEPRYADQFFTSDRAEREQGGEDDGGLMKHEFKEL